MRKKCVFTLKPSHHGIRFDSNVFDYNRDFHNVRLSAFQYIVLSAYFRIVYVDVIYRPNNLDNRYTSFKFHTFSCIRRNCSKLQFLTP